ncbi:QWRF motif-containing protein 7 [Phtheirospermum japonicum]|uniref:QWRF motif-containing protein 7 n=1 Tax=Phtheirospermum japonicum TaxID=374723 RepID=A0A830D4C9_9LAMI|nr:QWRF motif-containing protein 7 [Phtheirospermum japonicum]
MRSLPETLYKTKISGASEKEEKKPNASAKKSKKKQAVADGGDGGLVVFMPRSMSRLEVPRRSRSASTSPSAWALSSGRLLPSPVPKSPAPAAKSPVINEKLTKQESKGGGGGRVMSGVLKYFRQKKVSPLLEEEYHRYRVAYNRLLQWRFANARAEASMATVKRVAQRKVLNGWETISAMRNIIVEKRSLIQKLKREMKLYHILNSEIGLLNQWCKLEPRNVEAVGRVVRKLSAISLCLPLVQNAEANTMSVYDAIATALEVMDNIKAMILDMHWQVERTCFLLTELSVMLKQHKHFFQELEKRVTFVASLEALRTEKLFRRLQNFIPV